jgi:hypothetical protein
MSAPTREQRRAAAAERLLSSLEQLVNRHRALTLDAAHDSGHDELHVELIAAEVAHELAVARSALQRYPRLAATG